MLAFRSSIFKEAVRVPKGGHLREVHTVRLFSTRMIRGVVLILLGLASIHHLLPDIVFLHHPSLLVEVVRPAKLAAEDVLGICVLFL